MELTSVKLNCIKPHPDQPRTDYGDLEALAASLKKVGQLLPIILIDDLGKYGGQTGLYITADGHRRLKALKLAGIEEAKAIIAKDWEAADQLMAIMAANDQREELSEDERSRGLQTLLSYDVDVTTVAAAIGADVQELTYARKGFVRARKAAKEEPLTISLYEAELLGELTEEEVEDLSALLGKHEFTWKAERAIRERKEKQKRAAIIAETAANGAVYMDASDLEECEAVQVLRDLCDDQGSDITPEDHASCAGHAFTLNSYNNQIVWLCQNPTHYGHELRRTAESPEDRAKREEAEQERHEWVQARDDAHERRVAFSKGLLTIPASNMRAASTYAAHALLEYGVPMLNTAKTRQRCADLYFDGVIGRPSLDSLPHMVMVGLVFSVSEGAVADLYHGWRPSEYSQREARIIADWFAFLKSQGHALDEWEQTIFDASGAAIEKWDGE